MSRLSLRARSVTAAAAAILLAVALAGVGIDLLLARHLHRSLDNVLRRRAVEVSQLAASAPAVLTTPGSLDSPVGGTDLSVEVLDRHGRLVARSLSLGGRVLPVGGLVERAIAADRSAFANATSGGQRLRVYAAPLADVGGPAGGGAVVVAASTHDLEETLASLHLFVVGAGLAAAVLGALAVAVLMGRALRPLRQLAGAAAEIERTGDARRRLPEPTARDEVGELATTLNEMLASLERAGEAERRFLADASHELRTPLTALLGNVDYLARHGTDEQVLDEVVADAGRLARLADDLLALSREEAGGRPSELVRLDELARAAASGRVRARAPEPVLVHADRAALERALANLIRNAELYGPPGGAIEVTAEREDGLARLSVADEGAGLAPEEAENAFGRFWRGAHGEPGSGLGLAIVRATAERHGGRAYADGARFTIELPALRDVSENGATTEGA
ncbi:MAG TPA: HAMP domain-containing sensor histidine kinase [Solirubrobacteraceae bacterium]|nr:HAMP domain-containing sensor histidine kinase [Solirubrobacteraceae bacterium]